MLVDCVIKENMRNRGKSFCVQTRRKATRSTVTYKVNFPGYERHQNVKFVSFVNLISPLKRNIHVFTRRDNSLHDSSEQTVTD